MGARARAGLRSGFAAIALCGVLGACGTPELLEPPAAPAESLTGTWVGAVRDNVGRGELTLALVQDGTAVSGEGLLTVSQGFVRHSAKGSVRGRLEDGLLTLRLTPDDPAYCPYDAHARHDGTTLRGGYEGVNCRAEIAGDVTLHKR